MIRKALAWLFQGRLCPRCKNERTGHWGRYITGVPFDEWVCPTCEVVERIRFQEAAARWMDRPPQCRGIETWGPEVEGADQVSPGLYVGREQHSIFIKGKK